MDVLPIVEALLAQDRLALIAWLDRWRIRRVAGPAVRVNGAVADADPEPPLVDGDVVAF